MKTKFYKFWQNNPGGIFDTDKNLCHVLFIEALNAGHANQIAQKLGVYFDGCSDGTDCSCCGDRWDEACEYDAVDLESLSKGYRIDFPTIESYADFVADDHGWTNPECRIFYLSGEVKEFCNAYSSISTTLHNISKIIDQL